MLNNEPGWTFICGERRTWTWRCSDTLVSGTKASLEEAIADARHHGFDPAAEYWAVTRDGLTTHNRPGKPAVDLPASERLPGGSSPI